MQCAELYVVVLVILYSHGIFFHYGLFITNGYIVTLKKNLNVVHVLGVLEAQNCK